MLDWGTLGREKFERATAALIRRRHRTEHEVRDEVLVPNARGGDAGIDILVKDREGTWLYQQKYFPEGFSGGHAKSRRAQIRGSFDQAMKLNPRPDFWVLLVPLDLTLDERDWLNTLPDRIKKGPGPVIRTMGSSELDELLARNQDIEEHTLRDATSLALERVGDAVLADKAITSVEDYTARLNKLNTAADALDTDWTPRVTIDESGQEAVSVVPKHNNPRPIVFSLQINPNEMEDDDRDSFEDVVGYGLPGEVTVGTSPGKSIYHHAPAFLLSSHDPTNSYQWKISGTSKVSDPMAGKRVELRLQFADQSSAVKLLTIKQVSRGIFGTAIALKLTDICTVLLRLPKPKEAGTHAGSGGSRLNIKVAMENALPEEILEAMDLELDIASSTELILELSTGPLVMKRPAAEVARNVLGQEHEQYRLLMEDLTVIQRETRQKFIVPDEISQRDRVLLRFLRLLMEGHVVSVPGIRRIQIVVNEDRLDGTDDALEGGAFTGLLTMEPYTLHLFSRDITVPGPVYTYHPRVELEPVEGSDSRIAEANIAHITPLNSEYFVAYRPGQVRADGLAPTPWGLRGDRGTEDVHGAELKSMA